jgi:hypothetical protein
MNIKYDNGFFEYVEKAVDKWIGRIEGTTLNSGGSLIKSKVLKEINWTLYDKNMENEKTLTLCTEAYCDNTYVLIIGNCYVLMKFKTHDISRYDRKEVTNNWSVSELKSLCDFVERTIAQYSDFEEEYNSDKESEAQNKKQEAINALNEKIAKLNSTRLLFQDKIDKFKADYADNISALQREISDLEFEIATAKMELRMTEDKDYLNYT